MTLLPEASKMVRAMREASEAEAVAREANDEGPDGKPSGTVADSGSVARELHAVSEVVKSRRRFTWTCCFCSMTESSRTLLVQEVRRGSNNVNENDNDNDNNDDDEWKNREENIF